METITIKLTKKQLKELNGYVREGHYSSKSRFIKQVINEKIEINRREKYGWLVLAEKSLEKLWKNKKDEEVWIK
ncbi:MAG: ribbon-helix-helix domain-containing protein [Nanoarchaeota archaeon]